jgi:hypothetical protein
MYDQAGNYNAGLVVVFALAMIGAAAVALLPKSLDPPALEAAPDAAEIPAAGISKPEAVPSLRPSIRRTEH